MRCHGELDIAISLVFLIGFQVSIYFNVLNILLPELITLELHNVRVTDYSQVNR